MESTVLGYMAYIAYVFHNIRPDVYIGMASANDPVSDGTRVFMAAADKKALEDGDFPVKLRNLVKKGGDQSGK